MASLARDLRYALRGLRNQAGFSTLAILALALGIGAATTMFSVIDNVLLNPFPYRDAHRIATFYIHDVKRAGRGGRSFFPMPQWLEYRKQNHVFEDVIGAHDDDVLYTTPAGAELYQGSWLTANSFEFLGTPPLMGRGIVPDDARPGAPPVFVMAYKMWNKRFGQDTSVLGRSFTLNGVPTTLVGIMPPRFTKRDGDLYLPLSLDLADPPNRDRWVLFQARMKPGVTLKDVEADITVIAHRMKQLYPKDYPDQFVVQADSYADSVVRDFKGTLLTLGAAVGLLLLIACGNVANMLLARATAREKEMAIRSSLGASRWRLVRQLLCESLLLALGGAVAGCLFAYGGVLALTALIPRDSIPHEAVIRLNTSALWFSLGVAAFTALLFGLAPALQTARRDIVDPLRDSGKGVSGGFRRGRLRNALVVAEVGLSLVLLMGAGLMMRSFIGMVSTDLGFNSHNVLVARVPFPREQYKTGEQKQEFFRHLLPRLRALPGVEAASEATSFPPFGGIRSDIEIPGKTHSENWNSILQLVSEEYFRVLDLKLVRGRLLTSTDVDGARKVAVINQTLAARYFGTEDSIGRQVQFKRLSTTESPVGNPVFEVVGVIADARNDGVNDPTLPESFIPHSVTGSFYRSVLLKTARDPMTLVNGVRREIWNVDRNIALTDEGTLDSYIMRFTLATPRFSLVVLGAFAAVGLVLVAIGVFSVVAYTVSRQTHEIGIRVALGASRSDVLRMVFSMGLRLIAIGGALGLAVSFAATRVLSAQLAHVSAHDPVTLAAVSTLIALVGLAACYVPARRATRVDPLVALRYE
jgi:putative ABC transport system permease protein